MNSKKRSVSPAKRYTPEHDKSTGMALALLSLIVWFFCRHDACVAVAVFFIVCAMTLTVVLRPLAVLWFGLSELLGKVSGRAILFLVYIVLVFPVGLARRLSGCDELRIREFKRDRGSAFKAEERAIEARDICDPY